MANKVVQRLPGLLLASRAQSPAGVRVERWFKSSVRLDTAYGSSPENPSVLGNDGRGTGV